ncbi:DUF808 domain-containing protein [Aureivirga sp. CE67]|uniref:DUF808 domain-containing protein n=1 Tax=Aureivirga sp. CE67 TaxID=1788983 RepID=UPI0018CB25FF|nr:DUF808 domain-containing protein [Aureivirga sp. CE67]
MASGFFALLDDIAATLDDVAVMSKVATEKAGGILGDDLAVTAEKASGFQSSREIPVLWKICKGSFINKIIILPIAFLLSAYLPWLIVPILLIGGVYLAYEGAEKVYHYFLSKNHVKAKEEKKAMSPEEWQQYEKKKIKSAILVDFILSIEIVIIALSAVIKEPLLIQILSVSLAAIIATIGVYGVVALIVRMDDFGLKLMKITRDAKTLSYRFGRGLIIALPMVIRSLSVIGTIAMLLVAGGIFTHNVHEIHDFLHSIPSILADLLVGAVVGAIALIVFSILGKVKSLVIK